MNNPQTMPGWQDLAHPQEQLAASIDSCSSGPLFVHSDLYEARCFVVSSSNRHELLHRHDQAIIAAAGSREVWTPCFNYDFTKTGFVDLRTAPCETGPLGEFRRQLETVWRTADPVFSICGTGSVALDSLSQNHLVAFGDDSSFAELYRRDGTLLFYGTSISSGTILHYAETLAGEPLYRYDKLFTGTVVTATGERCQLEYMYHVRPAGQHLKYDFNRLLSDLRSEGLLSEVRYDSHVVALLVPVRMLVDFWVDAMTADPFYLLDSQSKEWVVPLQGQLGRRFTISDFE